MALQLANLDERTRTLMVEELEIDVANGTLYLSSRLNRRGQVEYEQLLRTSFRGGDDQSLADEIRSRGLLNASAQRLKPSGGFSTVRVPVSAPETLAEGEFNRFTSEPYVGESLMTGQAHSRFIARRQSPPLELRPKQ